MERNTSCVPNTYLVDGIFQLCPDIADNAPHCLTSCPTIMRHIAGLNESRISVWLVENERYQVKALWFISSLKMLCLESIVGQQLLLEYDVEV